MTHTELIAAIQEIIKDLYKGEYVGKIRVKDLHPMGYEVAFEHHQYKPTFYSASLPDDEFLKFIKKELRHAGFLSADRFVTVRNTTTFKQNKFLR